MPTRWLDQGATQALPIMKVGSRRLSGQLEIMFGTQVADKTNWRKLLKGEEPLNLIEVEQLIEEFAPKFKPFVMNLVKTSNSMKPLKCWKMSFHVSLFTRSMNILKKSNHIIWTNSDYSWQIIWD